jgi:hypothetical protein
VSRKPGTPNKPRHKIGIMSGEPILEYACRGYVTPCWIWLRVKTAQGYGCTRYRGAYTSAHIAMFKLFGGVIPKGMQLDHLCKVRDCVRPDHLEVVTPLENTHRSSATKLSQENIEEIRHLFPHMMQKDIAKQFGVSRSCISHIKRRTTWPL